MGLEFYDREGSRVSEKRVYLTSECAPDQWIQLGVTGIVPAHARSCIVSLSHLGEWGGGGVVYADSINLAVSTDTDKDGMPDRWENEKGLNSADPWDALADPDGDALRNIYEYRNNTDPHNSDTDQDGIPDAWEVEYGLDPLDATHVAQDGDNDGLTDLEEYQIGTDPLVADTDGDSIPDGMEVNETDTDPLDYESAGVIETVFEVNGADVTNMLGDWVIAGDCIYAEDCRGWVEYQILAPTSDIFRIEIEGAAHSWQTVLTEFELVVYVDGEYISRLSLVSENGSNSLVSCFIPWLQPGNHTVRLLLDNALRYKSLSLSAVRLQTLAGLDSDENGMKDWVEARLGRECGIDVLPETSAVSPVCLEGRGCYLSMMSVSDDAEPQHGIGDRWYADVPLNESGMTDVRVSFQNGGFVQTGTVEWAFTDLLNTNDIVLRKGDALLLTAKPQGAMSATVSIAVGSITNYVTDTDTPVAYAFTTVGEIPIQTVCIPDQGAVVSNAITVTVVDTGFGDTPACWVGKERTWDCPDLADEAEIQYDSRISFAEVEGPSEDIRQFKLSLDAPESRYAVARLGQDGSILANAEAQGFRLFSTTEAYVERIETYEDGSQLIEVGLVLSPLLTEVTVRAEIIVAGIVFADGSVIKDLTASDFDPLGRAKLQFIRDADAETSVCHTLEAFQNGVSVGVR